MCNFMGTIVSKVQIIKLKQIEKELGILAAMGYLEIMKDGFKYSNSIVITKKGNNDIDATAMHWEFIPPWIKNSTELKVARKQGIPWLNATSEKLLDSKMFRSSALKRRCLVLATHFFEWRHYKTDGAKKEISYPYIISTTNDYFYMAGIWQPWTDKETGEIVNTFAIITTKANKLMEQIHNTKKRMPTILTEKLAYEWIMEDLSEERINEIASYQLPSQYMFAHSIAKDFKTADDPTKEFIYEDLPVINFDKT
jgi:putative SOS response-associated peptidase YedK